MFDHLFTTDRMRAIVSDSARIQGMLDFEAALARAEARAGMMSEEIAETIAAHCHADRFAVAPLAEATVTAGNPAIPLIAALTERVAADDAEAARYVHWGATSQDAMDTGLVLQLRDALDALEADLTRLADACARLAERTANLTMAGRTWLQQALPITFGVKAAGWLSAVNRHRERLRQMRPRVLTVQLGGAVGTLAAFGSNGLVVAEALADDLGLALPDVPWHAHRDRLVEVATTLGALVGTLGKMARDISLLAQTEVGEAFEPAEPGKGASSTMPQKRNPVGAAVALAAAVRVPGLVATMLAAMPQEHERGLGGWQAEWETLPEIVRLAAGALWQMAEVAEGLELDAARMRANLDITKGVICAEAVAMALVPMLGKTTAHQVVEDACRQALARDVTLRAALVDIPQVTEILSADTLDRLCDPRNATGLADQLIQRALARRVE
ncbi:MAG TPA: 3-carboxy-cis,cis-muconate cycloisomerase [Ktedonobacterales bacterium]|nr:3-carboxy-cis,cis-muconate cycloisomerase [Ktedonobacterales bacterium]